MPRPRETALITSPARTWPRVYDSKLTDQRGQHYPGATRRQGVAITNVHPPGNFKMIRKSKLNGLGGLGDETSDMIRTFTQSQKIFAPMINRAKAVYEASGRAAAATAYHYKSEDAALENHAGIFEIAAADRAMYETCIRGTMMAKSALNDARYGKFTSSDQLTYEQLKPVVDEVVGSLSDDERKTSGLGSWVGLIKKVLASQAFWKFLKAVAVSIGVGVAIDKWVGKSDKQQLEEFTDGIRNTPLKKEKKEELAEDYARALIEGKGKSTLSSALGWVAAGFVFYWMFIKQSPLSQALGTQLSRVEYSQRKPAKAKTPAPAPVVVVATPTKPRRGYRKKSGGKLAVRKTP